MEATATISKTDVDALGELLAQIKTLSERADVIKASIKDEANLSGQKSFLGALYIAQYSEANRSTVDWRAVAKEANIPATLIAKHTSTAAVFSVKVTAR